MEHYLVQNSSQGRIKFLHLSLVGEDMQSVWGLIGGKTQTKMTSYQPKNVGRSNEMSIMDVAIADIERKVARKVKNGYRIVPDLDNIGTAAEPDKMDFDNPPTSFCPSKPISQPTAKHIEKATAGTHIYQVKENGMCHYAFFGSTGKVRIFTRRMNDHTAKYPGIALNLKQACIPKNSVLGIELVVSPGIGNHQENHKYMQQISKVDTHKGELKDDLTESFARQQKNQVRGCVFSIYYWDSEEIWKKKSNESLILIETKFHSRDNGNRLYAPKSIPLRGIEQARTWLKQQKGMIEGLVLWDLDDKVDVGFSGKPKRRASYKIKIVLETDVIAYGWEEGKTKGEIGSLLIGKLNKDHGLPVGVFDASQLIEMGKVGSGLKGDLLDPANWDFPQVIEIKYDVQNPNGSFIFPRFSKVHEDKVPAECIQE